MSTRYLSDPLLPIVGLLLALSACTPPTPPPSPTPWPTATPVTTEMSTDPTAVATSTATPTAAPRPDPTSTLPTTTIDVWESLPEAQTQALSEDILSFQAEFPQYEIELHHYENPEDFMVPLTAGELSFDVVLVSPVLLGSLWSGDQIAAMSDFFPPSFVDGFASVTLKGASQAGDLWGLPDTAGFHLLLFYNRELVDRPPATTEDLVELAQTLTVDSQSSGGASQWGLGLNTYDPLWLVPWLSAYGGWLTDESGRPTLDTPAMESALELYLAWHDSSTGIAPVATYEEVRTQFLRGDMAMVIDGEWAIGELDQAAEIDWGVARLPGVAQEGQTQAAMPLVLARYWAISRSATGNRALAATAFLEQVTNPERQLAWTEQFGLLPTRRQTFDAPLIITDSALRASVNQMQAGRGLPLGVNTNALLNAMRDPLRAAIDGQMTPAEAAKIMQTNVER